MLMLIFLLFPPLAAQAQALKLGTGQLLMLQAAQKVQQQDFIGALKDYDTILAQDGSNINAYIQRSVVKREIKDTGGAVADARFAARLAENGLRQNPTNARLYYQRGMAYRLMKDYPKAKENIAYAMRLPGAEPNWQHDLRNTEIEERFNQNQ